MTICLTKVLTFATDSHNEFKGDIWGARKEDVDTYGVQRLTPTSANSIHWSHVIKRALQPVCTIMMKMVVTVEN